MALWCSAGVDARRKEGRAIKLVDRADACLLNRANESGEAG